MKLRNIIFIFLSIILLLQPTVVFTFETDQYNLSPEPLADIGDEVSQYVEQNLRKAVDKINAEITRRQNCIDNRAEAKKTTVCTSIDEEKKSLEKLRSEDAVVRGLYGLVGTGIPPFTSSGTWMESHRFHAAPARFKTTYADTIFTASPLNYLTISSTVDLYGSEFGTDKIAHFFQQGYTYYGIYTRAIKEGLSPADATKRAVNWGRKTERTIYGYWVSRTFSNADLVANFAGLRFYQGLTREIKIGETVRPAIVTLKNGEWTFNQEASLSENLLKPFISKHLNEALNPSIFSTVLGLRSGVRKKVKNHSCALWFKRFPQLSKDDLEATSQSLHLWHGEDYGFKQSENFITIQNACFN